MVGAESGEAVDARDKRPVVRWRSLSSAVCATLVTIRTMHLRRGHQHTRPVDRVRSVNLLDTMSPATCAAIAQIMPVFLVALIAERVVFRKSEDVAKRRRNIITAVVRIGVDLLLACALLFITLLTLTGIEVGGIEGEQAETIWLFVILLFFGVLYRWLLLSTPLLEMFDGLANAVAAGFVHFIESIGEVPIWLARAIQVFGELIAGVLSVGLTSGVQSLADLVTRGLKR